MDMVDILGGLLGHKSGGSGRGPDILKDILNRGRRPAPEQRPESKPKSSGRPKKIEEEARDLEDMLNVSHGRDAARRTGKPQPQQAPRRKPADAGVPVDSPFSKTREERSPFGQPSERRSQDDPALVLVRAMLNAAKADGRITSAEQQSILDHVGRDSEEALQFLRDELAQPLDVREFAWSVPLGMEQQVYAMSLIAIEVDSRPEADYLRDLAHGLRLPAEVCEQLHRRYDPNSNR